MSTTCVAAGPGGASTRPVSASVARIFGAWCASIAGGARCASQHGSGGLQAVRAACKRLHGPCSRAPRWGASPPLALARLWELAHTLQNVDSSLYIGHEVDTSCICRHCPDARTSTSGMSRPRAATSVATSSGTLPLLNCSTAAVRWPCEMSPWMATACGGGWAGRARVQTQVRRMPPGGVVCVCV